MADKGTFPGAYVSSVPEEGSDPMMVLTNLRHMDIGARKSTLSGVDQSGPKELSHVGGTTGAPKDK